MWAHHRVGKGLVTAAVGLALAATALAGGSSYAGSSSVSGSPAPAGTAMVTSAFPASATEDHRDVAAEIHLYNIMHKLWFQHMEWTYATVDAFFHNHKALDPTLARLLQDQRDIGAAFRPFYGRAAAHHLTKLLLTHINDAVPVLQAAQAGNTTRLKKATAAWYANAKRIADFLSSLNRANWPRSATEPMLKRHITQTITYSVDLLEGHYAKAITAYGRAEQHMAMFMANVLSKGIIAQFPGKFTR